MKKKHKGSSLVLALGISLSLLILVMAISTTLSVETKTSINQQKKIQAYYIARSGATAAAKWITSQNNLSFPLNSYNNSFGNGLFDLSINQDENNPNKIIVNSIGKVANGTNSDGSTAYATNTATIILNANTNNTSNISNIKTAIWGINNLTIKSTVNGDVGTSSQNPIILDWGFNINGTIYSNGTVTKPNYSNPVTVKPLSDLYNYLPPIFPSYPSNLTNMPNILLSGGEPNTHYSINGNTYYDTITVTQNRFLQINTNNQSNSIIRIKNFDVQQGRIIINGSGNVTLFIDNLINLKGAVNKDGSINDSKQLIMYCNNGNNGSLNLANGVYINGSLYIGNTPINITGGAIINGDIVTTSQDFKMGGGSNALYGIIYAPNANIDLSGGANINGAVIGKTVTLENAGETVTLTNNLITPQHPISISSSNTTTYTQDHWQ